MRKVVRFNSPPDFSSLHIQPVYHIQSAIYYYIWQNSEAIIIFHFPADNLDRVWRSSLDGRSWTHTCKERERKKRKSPWLVAFPEMGGGSFFFNIFSFIYILFGESTGGERRQRDLLLDPPLLPSEEKHRRLLAEFQLRPARGYPPTSFSLVPSLTPKPNLVASSVLCLVWISFLADYTTRHDRWVVPS